MPLSKYEEQNKCLLKENEDLRKEVELVKKDLQVNMSKVHSACEKASYTYTGFESLGTDLWFILIVG